MSSGFWECDETYLVRDLFLMLAFDRRVQDTRRHPFRLHYEHQGKERLYTPDAMADYIQDDKRWSEVYAVKSRRDLEEGFDFYRPQFKAAVAHCRANGWRFKIISEQRIRGSEIENLRFLRRYRDLPRQEVHRAALLQSLSITGPTTPQTLLAATWFDKERQMAALCELWRLVAVGEVKVEMCAPLTMKSLIWDAR